jgi:hypothetical protein
VPFVLGNDMAGVILRVGSAVRLFVPGDEVYARPGTDNIGTFAELAAVHEDDLALTPATSRRQFRPGLRCYVGGVPIGPVRVALAMSGTLLRTGG